MARGVTTEWEDLHVKKGNWKAKEHVPTSEEIFMTQQEVVEKYDNYKDMNAKQIEEAIEDDPDLEDDDFMQEYRKQRMGEMKAAAEAPTFPGMIEITKADYEWHTHNMPKDTLGIILLYQDHIVPAKKLKDILNQLAAKHKTRKFMQI